MKARSPTTGSTARIAAHWNGVRMRRVRAGADPDAATRLVTLPADWDDGAAAALAQLAPGRAEVSLAHAATRWIHALADDTAADMAAGTTPAGIDLAGRLATMLLYRIAAPNQAVWQGSRATAPAFVLNLAAFVRPGSGLDVNGFAAAVGAVSEALLVLVRTGGRSGRVLLGNLDACLAALGLDYDSEQARDVAACLLALATASAHPDRVPPQGVCQQPPARCVVPPGSRPPRMRPTATRSFSPRPVISRPDSPFRVRSTRCLVLRPAASRRSSRRYARTVGSPPAPSPALPPGR